MSDRDELAEASVRLRAALLANAKPLLLFLAGWLAAWIVVAAFVWLAPERLCT